MDIKSTHERHQAALALAGAKAKKPTTLNAARIADERRRIVELLIQSHYAGADRIRIELPDMEGDMDEILAWRDREEQRLAETAPESLKLALRGIVFLNDYAAKLDKDKQKHWGCSMSGELLTRPEVETRTGLSCSSIYRLMSEGEFPTPIKIGQRAVRWRSNDLEAYLENRPNGGPEMKTAAPG